MIENAFVTIHLFFRLLTISVVVLERTAGYVERLEFKIVGKWGHGTEGPAKGILDT